MILFIFGLMLVIPTVAAGSDWSEKLQHWYETMKNSQGIICVFLGSCILLALLLVLVNLHLFSYRNQRRQHQFLARLNYLLDTRVVPNRTLTVNSDTRGNSTNTCTAITAPV